MRALEESASLVAPGAAGFCATHWSVVLAAKRGDADAGRVALETLCRIYWRPLYGFVLRQGYTPHDAEDLTQAFFTRLLEKDYLNSVHQSKGKFRSFLLAAMKHFLANERRNALCQKRGGHCSFVSLNDSSAAEQPYAQALDPSLTPEKHFDRQWAAILLGQVLGRLRQEFVERGKEVLFEQLKEFLTDDEPGSSYATVATQLGCKPSALRMAVNRMRRRYRKLLREEIGHTVHGAQQIDAELRALRDALAP